MTLGTCRWITYQCLFEHGQQEASWFPVPAEEQQAPGQPRAYCDFICVTGCTAAMCSDALD